MLTFFATLLVNILIGTIFYLVISLKIEKSASEIQTKKIRKEMDSMIREFNMTADRNISLLENRITVIKRLLEKSGNLPVDIQLDERVELKTLVSEKNYDTGSQDESESPAVKPEIGGFGDILSHSADFLRSITQGLKSTIQEVNTIKETEKAEKLKSSVKKQKTAIDVRVGDTGAEIKIKDNAPLDLPPVYSAMGKIASPVIRDESEIRESFSRLTSRKQIYSLVSELVDDGFSVDDISRFSGIPAGEISLVMNLQGR
ncbi:MAG: hypothetical protein ACRCUT_00350 [Spirochaetota bacterium]